jgi:hypothetical protein
VQWTPKVALLLQHGFLLLDPPSEAPPPPLPTAECMRRWRAQKRAERDAARPGDLLTVPEAAAALGLTVAGIRSTFRPGTLTPTYMPERPHRPFIRRDEVEQYRQERLGQRGRKPRPQTPAEPHL